jgi:23S rRNA (guanosine2251-2'-O)-methyltransferase
MSRYIYGKNSVKAALEVNPEKVFKIFVAEGLKPDKRLQAIFEMAKSRKIATQMVTRMRLDQMLRAENEQFENGRDEGHSRGEYSDSAVHQGVVASVAPKPILELNQYIRTAQEKIQAGEHPRLLILDGVTDPRNFGAILRVADGAGIDAVMVSRHNSASFGPAVTKTASGAEETVPVILSGNLNQAIQMLKKAGFWIAGAAYDEKAVLYHKQDYQMPLVLVLGSEGEGLAPLVQKNCDFLVSIPMRGSVDSLNVSTAAAVLLFEINRHVPARTSASPALV